MTQDFDLAVGRNAGWVYVTDWTALATVGAPGGTVDFADKSAVNLARRFYRVVQ